MSKTPGPRARPFSSRRKGMSLQRPDGPDCVEMAQHQSRPLHCRARNSADQVVSPVSVGDDLDGRSGVTQESRQQCSKRIERRLVTAGRLRRTSSASRLIIAF